MKTVELCKNCKHRIQVEVKHQPGVTETKLYCKKRMKEYGYKVVADIADNRLKECRTGSNDWCAEWQEFKI